MSATIQQTTTGTTEKGGARGSEGQFQVSDPYASREIAAQESMANASIVMAAAATLSLLITFFGTLLIWRQVTLTRQAVEDTANATEAMRRQNDLAEAAQRPWLELDVSFDFLSIGAADHHIMSIKVHARNLGKLPAQNTNIHHVLEPKKSAALKDFRKISAEPLEERRYQSQMIVLPGSVSSDQELLFFSKSDPIHVREHEYYASFLIILTYDLPSGKEARTAAWFRIGPTDEIGNVQPIQWRTDPDPDDFVVHPMGYMLVT